MSYFSIFITVLVILWGVFAKQSKGIARILLLLLFVLFAFERTAEGDGDYANYLISYQAIGDGSFWALESYEPLYLLFGYVGNFFHLSFDLARGILCFFEILVIYRSIKKLTSNTAFVLSLFFVFPALFDAELFRWSMGFTFLMASFPYLISAKDGVRKDVLKFIILVLCASLAHASCFFFLLLLFVLIKNKKKRNILILSLGLALLFSSAIFYRILGYLPLGDSIQDKYHSETLSNWHGVIMVTARQLLVFVLSYVSLRQYQGKFHSLNIERSDSECTPLQRIVFDINIIMLLIIPVSVYTSQVLRYMQIPLVLNYISCAKTIEQLPYKRNIIGLICLVISTIILLYMIFYASEGTMPVFLSHFREGYLINLCSTLFR